MSEIDRILEEEGFRSKPYQDHLGNWTFGHGLTYITEEESAALAKARYLQLQEKVRKRFREFVTRETLYDNQKCKDWIEASLIVAHMAYQLGYQGVMNFKLMWAALEKQDYKTAAAEMRDSKWYTQTPERAERLAKRMEALG